MRRLDWDWRSREPRRMRVARDQLREILVPNVQLNVGEPGRAEEGHAPDRAGVELRGQHRFLALLRQPFET